MPHLLVLEAKVLLGQLVQVGAQELSDGRGDGQLALLGAHGNTRETDDVAAAEDVVEGFKVGGGFGVAVWCGRAGGRAEAPGSDEGRLG